MMDPVTKDLIFKVLDEKSELLPLMHFFTGWKRCDDMLRWCIKNDLIGQKLLDWKLEKFGRGRLEVVKYIYMKLEKESTPRPLFIGETRAPMRLGRILK